MNFICAETNASSIIIYVVLIVVMLALLIMPYFTQKKKNQEFAKMLDAMKVGDLVKTAGGIIGRITKITDKGDIKTVILETGSKTEKSYMEFDMSMIYCVLKVAKAEEETANAQPKVEEKVEEVKEKAETEEVKAEETKTETAEKAEASEKKTTAKKAPAKKATTAKKSTKTTK